MGIVRIKFNGLIKELELTHFMPLLSVYTRRKHEKTFGFSDVFRRYRKRLVLWNGLISCIIKTKLQELLPLQTDSNYFNWWTGVWHVTLVTQRKQHILINASSLFPNDLYDSDLYFYLLLRMEEFRVPKNFSNDDSAKGVILICNFDANKFSNGGLSPNL